MTISGLGNEAFDECMKSMQNIDRAFALATKEDGYEQWVKEKYEGVPCMTFTNRYFTPKMQAQGSPELPLLPSIDPQGILRKLAGHSKIHVEENQVAYFAKRKVQTNDQM